MDSWAPCAPASPEGLSGEEVPVPLPSACAQCREPLNQQHRSLTAPALGHQRFYRTALLGNPIHTSYVHLHLERAARRERGAQAALTRPVQGSGRGGLRWQGQGEPAQGLSGACTLPTPTGTGKDSGDYPYDHQASDEELSRGKVLHLQHRGGAVLRLGPATAHRDHRCESSGALGPPAPSFQGGAMRTSCLACKDALVAALISVLGSPRVGGSAVPSGPRQVCGAEAAAAARSHHGMAPRAGKAQGRTLQEL